MKGNQRGESWNASWTMLPEAQLRGQLKKL